MTFVSDWEWLHGSDNHGDDTAIVRLLSIDRSTILVSSTVPANVEEKAIFGKGFGNFLVAIDQGLLSYRDPSKV